VESNAQMLHLVGGLAGEDMRVPAGLSHDGGVPLQLQFFIAGASLESFLSQELRSADSSLGTCA